MTPEVNFRIAELRTKTRLGTATREDMKEALALLREGRITAAASSARAKAKKAPVDVEADLKELEGM